jgi:hypothetical protein
MNHKRLFTPSSSLPLTLLLLAAAAAPGCSGETTSADAGVAADAGAAPDAGEVAPDGGTRPDAGPRPDAGDEARDGGHYCAAGDEVQVDGRGVTVDRAATVPVGAGGDPAALGCIDNPRPEMPVGGFVAAYCITECVEFLGHTPTAAEVAALELSAFPQDLEDGELVDPSFDPLTFAERSPRALTGIGARFVESDRNRCPSGWQVEAGFLTLGAESFETERPYVLRVRTASASDAVDAWVTTYHFDFIRRNDQVPTAGNPCGTDEARIPSRSFTFPVVSRRLLEQAIGASSAPIPGADDLEDGFGNGFAMFEMRECSGATGVPMSHATAGTLPAPLASFYPTTAFAFDRARRESDASGRYLALGFTGTASTASAGMLVHGAVGVTRDGTCTEEFGGITFPVFPDALTFVRTSRETVIHSRR